MKRIRTERITHELLNSEELLIQILLIPGFIVSRYVELTEEDKEKLKGSYKVAKKLEKLESKDSRGFDSGEEKENNCFDHFENILKFEFDKK